MEFNEVVKKKNELQVNISNSVHELVEQFKQETGVSPNYISIHMNYLSVFGKLPEYVVGKTKIDLDI